MRSINIKIRAAQLNFILLVGGKEGERWTDGCSEKQTETPWMAARLSLVDSEKMVKRLEQKR